MTAFPDHGHSKAGATSGQDTAHLDQPSSMRRTIASCAGAALYMSSLGIWFVPAEDSATQLIKLAASCVMLATGAYLFHGVLRRNSQPEVQIDLAKRQLRVYEYDAKGHSSLKSSHYMDDLQELSLKKDRLLARDEAGEVMMDVQIGAEEGKAIIQALQSAAR